MMRIAAFLVAWLADVLVAAQPATAQVVTNADCHGTRAAALICAADGKVVPSQSRQQSIPVHGANGIYYYGTTTVTNTSTVTDTATSTSSITATFTATGTVSGTTSTAESTKSFTETGTWTRTSTFTDTYLAIVTSTGTITRTGYYTFTAAGTAYTHSHTGTFTGTATMTGTGTSTTTDTGTATLSKTGTGTNTATSTISAGAHTISSPLDQTLSMTVTATRTGTLTVTATFTPGGTKTITGTGTDTFTDSVGTTATGTASATGTQTHSWYATSTRTVTATSTRTFTATDTDLRYETTIIPPDVPGADRFYTTGSGACEHGQSFELDPYWVCDDATGFTPTVSMPATVFSNLPLVQGAGSPPARRWVSAGTIKYDFWAKTTSAAQIKFFLDRCSWPGTSPEVSLTDTTTVAIVGTSWTHYIGYAALPGGYLIPASKTMCLSASAYTLSGTPTVDFAAGGASGYTLRVNGPWILPQ